MTPQLKVIWHLFNLCAIGFALAAQGSTEFSIFPSKEPLSTFPPVEAQNLGYILSAAPFSNGSAIQPPLASHSFESSPLGPENIQPLPHLPSTVTVSPTQSAAAAPTVKSLGPNASIKVTPSKEPPLPVPPPTGVPSHDLTLQQPAPSPEFFAPLPPEPQAPLRDLAPQNPAQVYAPPPVVKLPGVPALQSPALPPHIPSPLPPVAQYASAPPQASMPIRASSPASTAVPSRFSSLPPSAISPHTSVSPPPVMSPHIFASPPPGSPFILSTPSVPPPRSLAAPPPLPSEHASAPSDTAGQRPSTLSPITPTHHKTLHHFNSPSPVDYHHLASSPHFVPLEVMPSADSAPPPSPTRLPHDSAPFPAVAPHEPSPYLDAGPPHALGNLTPPMQYNASAPPPTKPHLSSHSSTPPPEATPSHVTVPPIPSTIPPITIPSPIVVSPPPGKLHFLAPPPTSMPYVSAPPPNSTITEHSSSHSPPAPMLVSNPPPDVVPPTVASSPPKAAESPPASSHFLAPPPSSMPYVSAPPPNATISEHSSAPPPPSPPIDASNPPPHAVPPTVSPPAPDAAPSHDLTPSPPAESSLSAPPPSSIPTSSPASKSASSPPSASVSSNASAPSTSAVPPVTATPPSIHTVTSGSLPPASHQRKIPISQASPVPSKLAPLAASPVRSPSIIPHVPREPPSIPPDTQLPLVSSPAPSIHQRGHQVPVTIAPSGSTHSLSPTYHQPEQGISPYIAPSFHKSRGLPSLAPITTTSPPTSPPAEAAHSPSFSPLPSTSKAHPRNVSQSAPETSYTVPSPAPQQHVQVDRPSSLLAPSPESAGRYHSPTSHHPAMAPSHSPSTEVYISPVPMSDMAVPSGHSISPFLSPEISPTTRKPELAPPILALPPPPPNRDCSSYSCLGPYTNTIAGSPCGCVLPMKVELRLGVPLYIFFPSVPEFAHEVAAGIFIEPSQVRIMGANAASAQPDKTLLLVDLVPLGDKFDNITAFLIYERFWNKQINISNSLFGGYEVLYVQYPGLPPSPPMAPSDIAVINGDPFPGDNGGEMHPLGVDITKQGRKHRLSGSLIAIIVLAAVGAVLLCFLLGWILLFRYRRQVNQSAAAPHVYPASIARSTGPTGQSAGSRPSFSLSFESSVAAYTGSAKTFSAAEIEKATDSLSSSRVLGEGGFGRVYSGVLGDGTEVAVKVLKREDQQGGREFLAEVEMLSRLHHRNLVKLIGISVEEHLRCLVYELVPNGSVESHLHGIDRQISPLDWAARLKIALGAARGLAYLHEDSSPRVIHRDFKASNILLEADFTPKVSDFGLARTALDEENTHISTRVMGTFGYVAPEYAMTGHLLVKSDVYSYGVVLLELLTGRKPVDMSQPPGQENLVSWTRPYLTTKEALKSIVDPDLGPDISFDSVAKVAAIASMCVQPEVSHRPFMGEVVQALKLVCNECDSSKDGCDESLVSCTHENPSIEARDPFQGGGYSAHSYGSGRNAEDLEKGLSTSDIGMGCKEPESLRRHSSSGPIGGGKSWRFWKRARTTTSREAVGEHGMYRFWSGSH